MAWQLGPGMVSQATSQTLVLCCLWSPLVSQLTSFMGPSSDWSSFHRTIGGDWGPADGPGWTEQVLGGVALGVPPPCIFHVPSSASWPLWDEQLCCPKLTQARHNGALRTGASGTCTKIQFPPSADFLRYLSSQQQEAETPWVQLCSSKHNLVTDFPQLRSSHEGPAPESCWLELRRLLSTRPTAFKHAASISPFYGIFCLFGTLSPLPRWWKHSAIFF